MRLTPEEKAGLERMVKKLGFKDKSHFFRRALETLLMQDALGEELVWPLRFEKKKAVKGPRNKSR